MSFRPEGFSSFPPRPTQLGFPASFNLSFMPPGFPNIPPVSESPPSQPNETARGPATTVFIGNIEEKCTNVFLERMMEECGKVVSWKRIQSSGGKPQAFGFCEFEDPSGTLRALRLLNSLIVNGKQLIVKAEDKVREELGKWQLNKKKSEGEEEESTEDGKLPADEEDRKGDEEARKKMFAWIKKEYPETSISVEGKIEDEEESRRKRKEKKHHRRHSERDHGREHRHRSRRRRSSSRSSSRSRRSDSEEAPRKRKRTRTRSMSPDEQEARRELKRMLREKERSYQKRVEAWEEREEQRAQVYEKLKKKRKEEKSQLKHEAHKLRRFLEEYDDEEDDKWYKGEGLAARLKLREKEKLEDEMDRLAEEQEIEEAAKSLEKTESKEQVTLDQAEGTDKEDATTGIESSVAEPEQWTATDMGKVEVKEEKPLMKETTVLMSSGAAPLPKKSSLAEVFGMEDEEEVDLLRQRKTLVKFEITAEDRRQHMTDHERKEITRTIVRGIPTSRVILFKHPLDWDQVDKDLIEKKIKPWVVKKITALIGEEDDSLQDFICEKILGRTSATDILQDIKMILDEDAETFVVKLWRLLHYEVEAKRMGLSK